MERESFIFYMSYKNALDHLPEEEKYGYLCAIIDYALCGEEPKIEGAARACFELIRPVINKNNKLYENGCKGAEYGKLGGRPRKNNGKNNPKETPKKPQNNPKETPEEEVEEAEAVEEEVEEAVAEASSAPTYAREGSAKEKFFSEFPSVRLNGADDSSVDYAKLLEAFREGNEFLRNTKSMNYVTAHYSEIIGGGYRKAAAAASGTAQPKANAMQMWTELLQAIGRAKELRYDSYTRYEVYLYCKRDAESKKEVETIYESLPPEVRQIYDKHGFILLCGMNDEELKFERARFLKLF